MISDPRHRAQHRQLWIDKVRAEMDKSFSASEFERMVKQETLARLSGRTVSLESVRALAPDRLGIEFIKHDLVDSLPAIALRALKAKGYPQREVSIPEDWPACEAKVCGALNWCAFDILRNPKSHVMLLDDRTAKAVVDSNNEDITAAELQHLPHNPCLVEFYRPIQIAEKTKGGVRLRGIGFEALGDTDAPAAVVGFYLDYWESQPHTGARWPATLGIWFGGFNVVTVDGAARKQIGFEAGSDIETAITEVCKRAARNLWDFITSRSINYEVIKRKRAKHRPVGERPQHTQGLHSQLDREVFLLYLTHESKMTEGGDGKPHPPQWGYRVEVPGKFHQFVYCGKCGDLHRHDLLGHACRKCGEIVGPRANVRVEKYWHHPYVVGPEGAPLKDVVRDVHRQKRHH